MEYVENTWITNPTWLPATRSVFQKAIRANNDVEGWHNRLNRSAMKSKLSLYMVVTLLYKEVNALPSQLKMVSNRKLKRRQTPKTKENNDESFICGTCFKRMK
ncbi:hypothetical protein ACJMK2_002779 [Sinanodonta woodiana]|uniref:Uncharacterized protein n=1 Tax=Sinanodonta woodiana TaxID=1069815 RepID=A0ABD3XZH4_SINWO